MYTHIGFLQFLRNFYTDNPTHFIKELLVNGLIENDQEIL